MRLLIVANLILALTLLCANASADDCAGRSIVYVEAPTATRAFDVETLDKRGFKLTWRGNQRGFLLPPELDEHAHLTFFTPAGSQVIGVLDASADHHSDDRLFLIDPKGRVIAKYCLDDLFGPGSDKKATRSISHIWWWDSNGTRFSDDGLTLLLKSKWGAVATVVMGGPDVGLRSAAEGGRTRIEIQRVMNTNIEPLMKCVTRKQLEEQPPQILLSFTVKPGGSTKDVTVELPNGERPQSAPCLERLVKKFRFEEKRGGKAAIVRYPLHIRWAPL